MKNYLEKAMKKALEESKFEIIETNRGALVSIENAAIVYTKFNNKPDDNGSLQRSFKIILRPEDAEEMKRRKWNVIDIPTKDEEIPILPGIKVIISDKYWAPATLYFRDANGTIESSINLTPENMEMLDSVNLTECDIVFKPSFNSRARKDQNPYVNYLNRGFFNALNPKFFGGKYDNIECNPELQEELEDNMDSMYGDSDGDGPEFK